MSKSEEIILGGGCFWCLEAVYLMVKGVGKVTSGYAGGSKERPSYEEVSSGTTGHAEVVKVEFDPDEITLTKILDLYLAAHDPTSLNRQGADVGTQYRSIVLYTSEIQRKKVETYLAKAQENYREPIVTEVEALKAFYPAEAYHQNYFAKHPEQAYCQVVIAPKVAKVKKHFGETLKQKN